MKKIKLIYDKLLVSNKFNPSLLFGILTNPSYIIRKALYRNIYKYSFYMSGKMLDFGCGTKPYKSIFNVSEYIGCDIQVSGNKNKNNIEVFYDGKVLPFSDESFDSIFSSEVFEHIFNIEEIMTELYRVLKVDGYILVTNPFVWNEHEIPFDFARYTSYGLVHLFEKYGFEVILCQKSTTYIETIFQMLCVYINETILPKKHSKMRSVLFVILVSPVTVFGLLLSKILPKNNTFYANNILVAQKKKI